MKTQLFYNLRGKAKGWTSASFTHVPETTQTAPSRIGQNKVRLCIAAKLFFPDAAFWQDHHPKGQSQNLGSARAKKGKNKISETSTPAAGNPEPLGFNKAKISAMSSARSCLSSPKESAGEKASNSHSHASGFVVPVDKKLVPCTCAAVRSWFVADHSSTLGYPLLITVAASWSQRPLPKWLGNDPFVSLQGNLVHFCCIL